METAYEILESLQAMFGQQSNQCRHEATRSYMNAKMKKVVSVREHVLNMTKLVLSLSPSHRLCHTPNPGPTRLADPNRVRGARPYTRTLYLIFFSKPTWYLWVWPTSYNIIKISYTYTKLYYHRSGVNQNLYT